MKIKNTRKKGFTIVELVIVIAVIAILAGVLIPTFASVVKKANLSADQSAVRQMNTALSVYDVDGTVKTVADAIAVLNEADIDLEDYKALTKDHYFYFVMDKNNNGRIVLADKDNNIVYPEDFEMAEGAQWMSLSGSVPTDDAWETTVSGSTATIASGAQLADFLMSYDEGSNKATEVKTINLSGTIDMKGSAANIQKLTSDLTISGAEGTQIVGLRADTNTFIGQNEFKGKTYGYGLIGEVAAGTTVTVENITLSGMVIGDTASTTGSYVGAIAGQVVGNLIVKNVTIKDCDIFGYDKVGAIAGKVSGSIELVNVKVSNTTVKGVVNTAAVVGSLAAGASFEADADCAFDISVSLWEESANANGYVVSKVITTSIGDCEVGSYIYLVPAASWGAAYREGYWTSTTNAWLWSATVKQDSITVDGVTYMDGTTSAISYAINGAYSKNINVGS